MGNFYGELNYISMTLCTSNLYCDCLQDFHPLLRELSARTV